MSNSKLETPVVLILFNRPEKTAKVFEAIRKAKPERLFVIADGPREDHVEDLELCERTRSIIDQVDWDCQVSKNYSNVNLGLKRRIGETGLNWVFDLVEKAIILEDDCIPHPTFFMFCQKLLDQYKDEERITSICGTNLLTEWKSNTQSYHFSNHFSPWGWATWRRVWKLYDVDIKSWSEPEIKQKIEDFLMHNKRYKAYETSFDSVYLGKLDSWAYQMLFLSLSQSGLSIVPSQNLVSNIGFDNQATNTSGTKDARASFPVYPVKFPLKSPMTIEVDRLFEQKRHFKLQDRSLKAKIFRKMKII